MDNPGIQIREQRYDLPTLDTILIAEERVMFLYSDCVVRDFIPAHPEATDEEKAAYERLQLLKIRDPNFKQSLACIAYQRKHPQVEPGEAWKAAGEANALEVDIAMLWGEGPDPHQSSQQPPESKTSTSEPSRSTDSGSSTPNGSDPADGSPASTGTSESETSSPGAPPIALVS